MPNAGKKEVGPTQRQFDHQRRRRERERGRERRSCRVVSFSLFSQPCTVIQRWQPVASFSVRLSEWRQLFLRSLSLLSPVSLFTTWSVGPSLCHAIPAQNCSRQRERAAYNPQSSFLASELTSHTRRRRRRPTLSAAHDSLAHMRQGEARSCLSGSGGTSRGSLGRSKTAKISRHETRDLDAATTTHR